VSPIRLIDADGEQVGIVDTREALSKAREVGLDLVEVAPNASPPVCRIMDYGKWMYDQKKKDRQAKSHRHETELKEIRIRTPKIGLHDLAIKVNRARGFLERGDRVQFTLRFRGREMVHRDRGRDVLNAVKEMLADVAKVERDMRMEGRAMSIVLSPTEKARQAIRTRTKPPGEGEGPAAAEAPPASTAPPAPAEPAAPTEPPEPTSQATSEPPAEPPAAAPPTAT
jgi:translation initiation factor IF-3